MKWGIAASAVLLLFALAAWTLMYGKPAGRTAPKVEEEFHAPTIGLAGASNDQNLSSDELKKAGENRDNMVTANLGGYPKSLSPEKIAEFANAVKTSADVPAPAATAAIVTSPPTTAQQQWLDATNPLVCVLEVNGQAVACPVAMLSSAPVQVLQLETNDHPWMLIWCQQSQTLSAYSRQVSDLPLTFRASNLHCQGDLVLVDSDSESQWLQLLGTAISGQFSGERLNRLAIGLMSWKSWQDISPQSHLAWSSTWQPFDGDTQPPQFQPTADWGMGFVNEHSQAFIMWNKTLAEGLQLSSLADLNLAAFHDPARGGVVACARAREIVELEYVKGGAADQTGYNPKQSPIRLPSGEFVMYPAGSWLHDLTASTDPKSRLPQLFPWWTSKQTWEAFHGTAGGQ